jgi:uncharacterized protein (DUF433 family)
MTATPASGMPHTPAQGADSPLERPETDDYCALCEVPTTTIGGQPWHTGHARHNEYWSECRGGWRPPKDIKTYTEALVSEMIPSALVTVDPDVQGGEPCMKGTRVQAYLVATLLEDGATWEQVKDIYPSIPTPEVPREAAQPGAGDAGTSGTGSDRGTGVSEVHMPPQAFPAQLTIPADMIGIQLQPSPDFEPALIPNEAMPSLARFINALKARHYLDAAASIRKLADADENAEPPIGGEVNYLLGMRRAAERLESYVRDLDEEAGDER